MRDIEISPVTQVLTVAAVVAGIAAVIAAQAPEIRRYLKVRGM